MQLVEDALIEWRTIQTKKRQSVSLNGFADYLEISRPQVSHWLNGERKITAKHKIKIAPKLAELLGEQVYAELGVPSPDPNLKKITYLWGKLPTEARQKLAEQAAKYVAENEKKQNKKPAPNPIR